MKETGETKVRDEGKDFCLSFLMTLTLTSSGRTIIVSSGHETQIDGGFALNFKLSIQYYYL
jgi:hypothetical protein